MHPFSIDTNERTSVTIYIFILGFAFCLLFYRIVNHFNISIPWYIGGPSIFGVFGIIYGFFDRHLWKVKFFRRLFRIKTPNLNGIWEGEYESSFKSKDSQNEVTKGKVKMTINQSWTKIRIESNNEKSNSYSIIAGIIINSNKGILLKFEYGNDADRSMVYSMKLHTGFNTLKYKEESNELEGTYYNDKNRRTYGILKYVKI